jgi:hypothetical protein
MPLCLAFLTISDAARRGEQMKAEVVTRPFWKKGRASAAQL